MNKLKSAAELEQLRNNILSLRDPEKTIVSICGGTGCRAYKCMDVVKAFQNEIDQQQLNDKIELKLTGCHGFCERGSLMVIRPKKIFYQRVTPEDIPEIIAETILKGNIIDRLLYVDPVTGQKATYEEDVPWFKDKCESVMQPMVIRVG